MCTSVNVMFSADDSCMSEPACVCVCVHSRPLWLCKQRKIRPLQYSDRKLATCDSHGSLTNRFVIFTRWKTDFFNFPFCSKKRALETFLCTVLEVKLIKWFSWSVQESVPRDKIGAVKEFGHCKINRHFFFFFTEISALWNVLKE